MKYLFYLWLVVFVGCAYKPVAYYTKKALGQKIYIELKVDVRDPQNSVILKDEISKEIFARLHSQITSKNEADSIIEVQLMRVGFYPLAENVAGFATFYRCVVDVQFTYTQTKTNTKRTFSKQGYHNFSLNESSVITDGARMDAINQAVLLAINNFISQIGIGVQ